MVGQDGVPHFVTGRQLDMIIAKSARSLRIALDMFSNFRV